MADPDAVEQAKLHFKNGTDLYDENNFRGALVEFQRAYELAPSYKILFNIGQVDMELQDYAGAMKAYSRYLREGGPDIPADRVTQVNSEIERLKGRIGHVIVQTNAGAEITIDDVQAGFAPLPESVAVNTGRHHVVVTVSGHPPVSRVIDVAGQQDVTVAMPVDIPQVSTNPTAPVQPKSEPAKPKPDGPPSNVPKYVAWGATGAFAITSVVFALSARSDEQELQKLRTSFPVTKADLDDQVSKETRAAALADGFGAAALVTGGIALYLTLRHTDGGSEEAQKTVQLHVTPAGASITGHF